MFETNLGRTKIAFLNGFRTSVLRRPTSINSPPPFKSPTWGEGGGGATYGKPACPPTKHLPKRRHPLAGKNPPHPGRILQNQSTAQQFGNMGVRRGVVRFQKCSGSTRMILPGVLTPLIYVVRAVQTKAVHTRLGQRSAAAPPLLGQRSAAPPHRDTIETNKSNSPPSIPLESSHHRLHRHCVNAIVPRPNETRPRSVMCLASFLGKCPSPRTSRNTSTSKSVRHPLLPP